ncbi:MAG: pantoate--beta-alanine ligase [Deltaproteobacteria bacterium]|nr:pantoate--beta-alanine ligase [Deltaproteobacteria bacterium]
MQIIRNIIETQFFCLGLKNQGKHIAFVPTMGFLHEGHLALVKEAKKRAELVVSSIFVNPTQFTPQEDLSRYPRDEEGDLKKLASVDCDLVFIPDADQMYPEGFQTKISLSEITQGLCGASRPGHFDGVATVVLKLFNITQANVAIFGEKDYQQLAVIRRLVKDLNLPIEIVGHPTERSPQGLALSSRNSYLSEEEKQKALVLFQTLSKMRKKCQEGEKKVSTLLSLGRKMIEQVSEIKIEYLEIVDAVSLKPIQKVEREARVLVAVRLGKTRLIDNGPL